MRLITNEELVFVGGGEIEPIGEAELRAGMTDAFDSVSQLLEGGGSGGFQVVEVTGHRLDFIDRLYAVGSVIAGDCIAGGSVGGTVGAIGGQFVVPLLGAGPGAVAGGGIGCTLGVGVGLIADIFDLRQTPKQ